MTSGYIVLFSSSSKSYDLVICSWIDQGTDWNLSHFRSLAMHMHEYSAFCVIFSVCGHSLLTLYRKSNYLCNKEKRSLTHPKQHEVKLSVIDDRIFNLGWTITLRSLIKTARSHTQDCWALVNMSISSGIESRHFQRNMEEKLTASPYVSDMQDQPSSNSPHSGEHGMFVPR